MASTHLKSLAIVVLFSVTFFTKTWALTAATSSYSLNAHHKSFVNSLCKSTPYPDTCFDTFKLSISIGINPNIISFLLQSLKSALFEVEKLAVLFANARSPGIVENQKGTLQDCRELHDITLMSLTKSVSKVRKEADVKAYLSGSLTNKVTCLEGLETATGPLKPALVNSITDAYKHVSNSLAMLSKGGSKEGRGRRLMSYPAWVSRKDRRILESSEEEYDPSEILTVAQDGSGNFSRISDAITFAPKDSEDRIIIFVREGVYEEQVEVPRHKTNIVLLGDGSDTTIVRGSNSVGDGWTTFRSATVAVAGEGFLARDISFENTAGAAKHQAVALRVNADLTAFYRCTVKGYQDTLYVHSFRQFYRECDIHGTVDFIFGNAAVVFQACNLIARNPMSGQSNMITAQSRTDEYEVTGIAIQNCSILAADDLNSASTKTYLGRPWKEYARTVFIDSYLDAHIHPAGWSEWSGDRGLDTLYYGEYGNTGPGSTTTDRVTWKGYHLMNYEEASNFIVSEFITGDEWLESTSFPYDRSV